MADENLQELTVRDLARTLRKRRALVLLAVLCVVLTALLVTLAKQPRYRAEALILLPEPMARTVLDAGSNAPIDRDRALQNEVSILEGELVYERLKKNLNVKANPPRVIAIPRARADVVSVRVQSADRQTAAILVGAYIKAFRDIRSEALLASYESAGERVQARIDDLERELKALDEQGDVNDEATRQAVRRSVVARQEVLRVALDRLQVNGSVVDNVQTISSAAVPTSPFEPDLKKTLTVAATVGLLIGLGAAFVLEYLDDSVSDAADLARIGINLNTLASIPSHGRPGEQRPIALGSPRDRAVEAYRTLRTNVEFVGLERHVKVIQVSSGLEAEGKTTVATNLAVVLARAGSRVLLIDADLRRPVVATSFSLQGDPGLTTCLMGSDVDQCITQVGPRLFVLTAGKLPANPSELLGGERMRRLVSDQRERFDYVILDSAPILAVSDSIALSRFVDGVIIVVEAGRTSAQHVRTALVALDQVNTSVLGVVLNKDPTATWNMSSYGYETDEAAEPANT